MSDTQEAENSLNGPLFRSAKRRKIFRKRAEDEDTVRITRDRATMPLTSETEEAASSERVTTSEVDHDAQNEAHLTVTEVLRRRKLGKGRRAGVEFSNTNQAQRSLSNTPQPAEAPATSRNGVSPVEIAISRFAPQTGKVTETFDKHMVAYIDSRMAEARREAYAPNMSSNTSHAQPGSLVGGVDGHIQRQPASLGKLQEIDLGPGSTMQNIVRTEAATKRLERGQTPETEDVKIGQKVRLGPDGKPWRRRDRRTSEDVKRDKLVEEVLRESRLDIYDEVEDKADTNEDQAADDSIAEEFRREFLDAMASKNIRRTAPALPGVKGEDRPKGPKLGGSRSARAAMRAQEEKAAKKR